MVFFLRRLTTFRLTMRYQVVTAVMLAGFLAACAKQGLPPGGAEDTIPPSLKASSPAQGMTNVPTDTPVVFDFSERMATDTVDDNIFIVPLPAEWPRFDWKSGDTQLVITFPQPLRENTTYVITVGAKASDLQRIPLNDSIVLSFSTGAVLENRKLSGSVTPFTFFGGEPEAVAGVDVAAQPRCHFRYYQR